MEENLNKFIKVFLIFIILFFIFIFIFAIKETVDTEKYLQSDEYKQLIETQEKCEHNYITTGTGTGRGLRVYSKCTKCGKEFK